MAQSPAAVQAVLGANPMNATIIDSMEASSDATKQEWYVIGNADAPGRARWCVTTAANSAALQAASILTQLRTG